MTVTRSAEKTTPKKGWDSSKQFRLNGPLGKKLMQRLRDNESGCRDMKPGEIMQMFGDFSSSGIPAVKFRNAVTRAKTKLGFNAEMPSDINDDALGVAAERVKSG